ncbi:MAG: hypothetical protein KBS91_03765 [Firmicutes bacterium]|nr:hypothetical protein [Candidatus Caballimonas caccae]
MKKGKAITLLSLISLILVALIVATFVRFSVGIKNYNSILGAVKLDYDMSGGVSYTYTLSRENKNTVKDIDDVVGVISSRLDKLGYNNYNIETIKDTDIVVEDCDIKVSAYNSNDIDEDMKVVFAYGVVQMKLGSSQNPSDVVLKDKKIISSAKYTGALTNGNSTVYPVSITFTNEAYDLIKKTFDDGSCYVELKLGDETLLSGSEELKETYFDRKSLTIYPQTEAVARREALQLSTGGLDYQYEQKSVEEITAVFGENSALYSLIVICALAVVVIVAFSIMFKGFGVVSTYSLIAFLFGMCGLLVAIPNIKVSLASVCGIIFALILSVDGLILTFNRIKEEFKSGKTVKAAVKTGYRRAFRPVLNIHVVSLIISLLIFALVGGVIKGFAITASIGIIISFISTALLSRLMSIILIPLTKNPEAFFNFKRTEE